ncbi:hypothetical protein, partial [Xanthovirga aplysinae]|uniref:hypothetical protein n=1 Tax=Xanthovirga aplysinae TaxID=2529853 RepID=UPI0012BD57C7
MKYYLLLIAFIFLNNRTIKAKAIDEKSRTIVYNNKGKINEEDSLSGDNLNFYTLHYNLNVSGKLQRGTVDQVTIPARLNVGINSKLFKAEIFSSYFYNNVGGRKLNDDFIGRIVFALFPDRKVHLVSGNNYESI